MMRDAHLKNWRPELHEMQQRMHTRHPNKTLCRLRAHSFALVSSPVSLIV